MHGSHRRKHPYRLVAGAAAGALTALTAASAFAASSPASRQDPAPVVSRETTPAKVMLLSYQRELVVQEQYAATLVKGAENGLASIRYQREQAQKAAAARARAAQAARSQPPAPGTAAQPSAPPAAGIFSFSQLEALWVQAGGSASTEATAACIAEHESGGNPQAVSPTNDWGLWQIHGAGTVAFDPMWNARTAVSMSSDGTNWSAWTTAASCGV